MKSINESNSALAYIYLLAFLPVYTIEMASQLGALAKPSERVDLIAVIGYLLLLVMLFVIVLRGKKRTLRSQGVPYAAIVIAFVFLLFLTIVFLTDKSLFSVKVLTIARYTLLVTVCLYLPFLVFTRQLGGKAKVLSILLSLAFAAYLFSSAAKDHTGYYGLAVNLFRRFGRESLNWLLGAQICYFVCTYILHGMSEKQSGVLYFTLVAGLFLILNGIQHPMPIYRGELVKYKVFQNSVEVGTTFMSDIRFNWMILIGIALVILCFIAYLATDNRKEPAKK